MTSVEGDDFGSGELRRGVWRQTATVVALVTTAVDDTANVMACEWAMMVSGAPLRFVISVGPGRATHGLIEQAGEFGLNFCSDDQAKLSHVSGSYSMNDVDKWELADFKTHPGKKIRSPMISGCTLNVECQVVGTYPLGDHTLFIGEALWARYNADLKPLIYHSGKYWRLGAQVPKE